MCHHLHLRLRAIPGFSVQMRDGGSPSMSALSVSSAGRRNTSGASSVPCPRASRSLPGPCPPGRASGRRRCATRRSWRRACSRSRRLSRRRPRESCRRCRTVWRGSARVPHIRSSGAGAMAARRSLVQTRTRPPSCTLRRTSRADHSCAIGDRARHKVQQQPRLVRYPPPSVNVPPIQ